MSVSSCSVEERRRWQQRADKFQRKTRHRHGARFEAASAIAAFQTLQAKGRGMGNKAVWAVGMEAQEQVAGGFAEEFLLLRISIARIVLGCGE